MSGIWGALSGALVAVLMFVGVYVAGRRNGAQRAKTDAMENQIKTKGRIDDATISEDIGLADRVLAGRVRRRMESKDR